MDPTLEEEESSQGYLTICIDSNGKVQYLQHTGNISLILLFTVILLMMNRTQNNRTGTITIEPVSYEANGTTQ